MTNDQQDTFDALRRWDYEKIHHFINSCTWSEAEIFGLTGWTIRQYIDERVRKELVGKDD